MTIMVATLRFDRRLSRVNTWHVSEDQGGIDARIQVASGPDVRVQIACRFRRRADRALIYCRPIDDETFQTESGVFGDGLPRLELILLGAPADTATILRSL